MSLIDAMNNGNPATFAALAKSYGFNGYRVEKTQDFAPVFEAALNADCGTVIDLKIDPEAITPRRTLSQFRDG